VSKDEQDLEVFDLVKGGEIRSQVIIAAAKRYCGGNIF